jgi:uncharacterized membrane protein YczE
VDRVVERLARCAFGLFLFGLGITFFIRAQLGLAPWDVFHTGVSDKTDVAVGTIIIVVGVILLLLWIPLRQRPGVGTVMNAVEIGLVVNLTKPIIGEPDHVVGRLALMLAGLAIVGLGSAIYIGSGLGAGPRDGLMLGLSERGVSIRVARTVIELTVLVTGIVLGGPIGLGTVAFALGIGPIVQVLLPRFDLRTRTSPVITTLDES